MQNEEEGQAVVDPTDQETIRVRRVPTGYRKNTFTNEVKQDKEVPVKRCAVCCRLLYKEEHCALLKNDQILIEEQFAQDRRQALASGAESVESMNWPLLNYRDESGMRIHELDIKAGGRHSGSVLVCARHKSKGSQDLGTIVSYMRFVNENWMYPGDRAKEIMNLNPIGEGYLSPLLVFCELTNSRSKLTPASRAGYHFVSGRIGLCKSKQYFGAQAGTRGLIRLSDMDVDISIQDKMRIRAAWLWMKINHPLIKDLNVDEPSDLTNATETLVENDTEGTDEYVDKSRLEACHMGPVGTGGPSTADEANNLANLTIGLLGRDQEIVKYSNPCLLGYLFPTLYPGGQGFFSLDYSGVKRRCIGEIEVYETEGITYRNEEGSIEYPLFSSENDSDGWTHDAHSVDHPIVGNGQSQISETEHEDTEVDSDSSDSEEEVDSQIEDNSKYSKYTIKNYAKFRLLSVDRRWGRNIKFILMMFDWIQKSAIFAYQRRLARTTTGGRKTTADDVLNPSYEGGTKYRESQTVAIPPFIRTGVKYKQALFQKFSVLFEEFGNPELFGTFTCDDRSAGQVAVARHFGGADANTHYDPVLFTMHWKRQWLRFWKFVTSTRKGREGWCLRKTGGIRAWCWVFELQDRGTPHTHFCLWTKNSIEQMISDDIISCSVPEEPEDRALVLKHQIHNCTSYCIPVGRVKCRFKYPKPPTDLPAHVDDDGRYVLPRKEEDGRVIGYNMDLLRFARVNMDLQYNQGERAKHYMCKYITMKGGPKKVTIVTEKDKRGESSTANNGNCSSNEYISHFHYRSVGVVEAVMDICGWKMHGCSRVDEFLPTELPDNRRRILKRAKDLRILVDDTDIFLDDKWTQYLKRPKSQNGMPDFENMTYPEYFKFFRFGKRKNAPNYVDGRGKHVCRRGLGKEALIRTREIKVTRSEDAFMHLLMLNHPWRTEVESWIGAGMNHETYQSLAVEVLGRDRIEVLANGLLAVLDYGQIYEVVVDDHIINMPRDIEWTEDQKNALDIVRHRLQSKKECLILVTGAAGTGKSTVLDEIHRVAKNERFEPIRLAPSGVAAVNIKGQTLHRWFRLTMSGRQSPEGNSYAIREQLMDIADQGLSPVFLIDEVSMISGDMLGVLSKALQEAVNADSGVPFGGIPIIMFGDFGQLGPVNRSLDRTDWIWNSEIYRRFERIDLIQPCRQSGDVEFKSMLDDIRRGKITSNMASMLMEICDRSLVIPGEAIHLYPFKRDVDKFNLNKLQDLPGEDWYSVAYDNARITKNVDKRRAIESETGLASVLWLKIGARVMCTSNVDVAGGIVNGTTGKVVRFYDQFVVQVREDMTGRIFNIQQECRRTKFDGQERRQFPLVLAWALTIHKCQSLTLDKIVVNLRDVFASGQAYVALSRVRTRYDLFIRNWSAKGLLSVKHAVVTRLTKDSEASRTEDDEELDKQEERDSERGGADVCNVGQNELRLQGWEDFTNSVLDLLYGSGRATSTTRIGSLSRRSSIIDVDNGGDQSMNDGIHSERKDNTNELADADSVLSFSGESDSTELEVRSVSSSLMTSLQEDIAEVGQNEWFMFRENKKRYYDSDSLGSDSIECESSDSDVDAVIISKKNKAKRRRVQHGSSDDTGVSGEGYSDSTGDSDNEVNVSIRESSVVAGKRKFLGEGIDTELSKKARWSTESTD